MTPDKLSNAFAALAEHQRGDAIMSANRIAHIAARTIDGEPYRSESDWQNLVASHEALRAALSRAEAERDEARGIAQRMLATQEFEIAFEMAAKVVEGFATDDLEDIDYSPNHTVKRIVAAIHAARLSRTSLVEKPDVG